MHLSSNLHGFVLALSISILTYPRYASGVEWPYNLPAHVKHYPEDEAILKRDKQISERLHVQQPKYVRKMSGDPGEKFFLNYWSFDMDDANGMGEFANTTHIEQFEHSLPLHSNGNSTVPLLQRVWERSLGRGSLPKRAFECPTDTQSCASIGRPNTCCPNGSTCQIVVDSGLGDVGCCEASQTCGGNLSQCPQDYTSCPNNQGGGCCLPGYACYQEGCVLTSTVIVTVNPTPTTTSIRTTTVIVPPTTITTQPPPTTPAPSTSNTLVCSSGYRSCPASLGGGCCPTDRACGRDVCPEISTSASLNPPVRPTTDMSTSTSSNPPSPSSSSTSRIPDICPGGFYACSAFHQGGCCQVGRDCARTSCPDVAGTTVVDTNGITAIVPTGTYLSVSSGFKTGSCASAWSTCDPNLGGGCCPSGYACGTAACSATVNGGQGYQVGKQPPNGSQRLEVCRATTTLGFLMIMIMISVIFVV